MKRMEEIIKKRFIPAGAGNTHAPSTHEEQISVHPRGCGEHWKYCTQSAAKLGSSPRVRGTLILSNFVVVISRFIPAGAGNTGEGIKPEGSAPVHPRGCGEHALEKHIMLLPIGSSPRVRGTRSSSTNFPCVRRFIPAGAGNTPFLILLKEL